MPWKIRGYDGGKDVCFLFYFIFFNFFFYLCSHLWGLVGFVHVRV